MSNILNLIPGSLIIMHTIESGDEKFSTRVNLGDPICLYIIIKRFPRRGFRGQRYLTIGGIVRLFESDFVNHDFNRVVL